MCVCVHAQRTGEWQLNCPLLLLPVGACLETVSFFILKGPVPNYCIASNYMVFSLKPNCQNSQQFLAEVFRLYDSKNRARLCPDLAGHWNAHLCSGKCTMPAVMAATTREEANGNLM